MDAILDDIQTQIQDSARRLSRDFAGPSVLRALKGASNDAAWHQIEQAGWPSLLMPVEQEGLGMGLFELSLVMEAAGARLLQAPVLGTCAANHVLARSPLASMLAHSEARDRAKAVVVIDEGDPYRARAAWPMATRSSGSYVITGQVARVEDLSGGGPMMVPAHADDGALLLLLIDRESPGVRTTAGYCIDGSRADALILDAVPVDASRVIAQGDAARALIDSLSAIVRVGTSAELIGLAQSALDMSLVHLKTRKQFGKHLASFQALQHRCVDCFLDVELNRSLLYRVARAWDEGQAHPAMVAALKARASRSALAITRAALQLHGAMGYAEEHDIGLYYKRATVLAARYGNENRQAAVFSELTLAAESNPVLAAAGAAQS